jgi:HAE1 family hydrophobic/amphiphilic exporter-1
MRGIVGRLLHEFAVTIAVAILISGFVSLTLTPMLGSRFLRYNPSASHGFIYRTFETGFAAMSRFYDYTLRGVLRHKFATAVVAAGFLGGTVYLFLTMPRGFIPSQD